MGFLDPKGKGADEEPGLPGADGLHLELDLRRCPACRRELHPWQERCPDCGEVGVDATAVAPDRFALPALDEAPEEGEDDGGDRQP